MTEDIYYCSYITFCNSPELPPFYLGSSSVEKVQKGYHGSPSKKYRVAWEKAKKAGQLKTHILSIHKNSRKDAYKAEIYMQTIFEVNKSEYFINDIIDRPGNAFVRVGEESPGHQNKGKSKSNETKMNMSKSQQGHPVKIETREKLSKAMSGRVLKPRSIEHSKAISDAKKGRSWSEKERQAYNDRMAKL